MEKSKSRFSLRRITSGGAYLPEVDGLRFVAIFSVVAFHISRQVEIYDGPIPGPHNLLGVLLLRMLGQGYFGVRIFFAISGFILALPFAKHYLVGQKPVRLRQYFLRRLTRLEPPYIAALLIRVKPVMVAKHLTFLKVLPHLMASLFYIHNLVYHDQSLVLGVAWSLEIEVQFYILAPLAAMFFFRQGKVMRRILLCLLLVGSAPVQYLVPHRGYAYVHSILMWEQFFMAGFLFADIFVTDFDSIPSSWYWDLVSAVLWPLLFCITEYEIQLIGPLLLFLLFIAAFKGRLFRELFRLPFISIVGGMCYSIYLTHSLVLQGSYAVFHKLRFIHGVYAHLVLGEIAILPVALAVGTVFFMLIERPCMDKAWPHKLRMWVARHFSPGPLEPKPTSV